MAEGVASKLLRVEIENREIERTKRGDTEQLVLDRENEERGYRTVGSR